MSLENKKIVVTGAASGIGAETAKVLKAKGATIVGVDRNEPKENVDQYINTSRLILAILTQLRQQLKQFRAESMRCATLPVYRRPKIGWLY